MIKLVVGLGNPGQKYSQTRHNVGFLFLDRLLGSAGAWGLEPKFEGYVASILMGGAGVVLLKPNTFMNRSGQSVGKVARYYKLEPGQILVVHDELDFGVGVAKFKKGGGHAGHNGLRDIIGHLGSGDFFRLRIGIGRPAPDGNVADYVLSCPGGKENDALSRAFDLCELPVRQIIVGEIDKAVNNLNALKK